MSVSQKVLVLGLGASGRTAARFYASRGFEVLAADTRPQPPKLEELQQEIANLRFLGAQVTPETAAEVSEVMISPGLSPEYSVFAPVVKEARQHGIPVVGEIELFARELKKFESRVRLRSEDHRHYRHQWQNHDNDAFNGHHCRGRKVGGCGRQCRPECLGRAGKTSSGRNTAGFLGT